MRNFLTRLLVAALSLTLWIQASPCQDKPLTFDAASVKPATPPPPGAGRQANSGGPMGPGTSDPSRIHYPAIRLRDLIVRAYNVKDYQLVGPEWLNSIDLSTRFAIDATMPPSTTKEQLRVMLQNLLAERFKLTVHRETRELPQYSLVVAKNGPKMKESGPAPPPDPDPYGFPAWQPGPEGGTWRFMINGRGRIGGARVTMQDLADELAAYQLKAPVADNTGLKAKYDLLLTYSLPHWNGPPGDFPVADEPLPDLFAAMQSQLGLKLEPKKGPVSVIVIDRLEKKPTEN